ncbi:MAG: hypothetical protein JO359_00770 [Candidatus Eremiobacteraeota bacterium]|nr:hypothetical protein [Candidatus Eremiobacteraeota bacterium]
MNEISDASVAKTRPLAYAELAESRQHKLPRDHPHHPADAIALGSRGRGLVRNLRPLPVRVMTSWDHRARTVNAGARRISVDGSGSYRID